MATELGKLLRKIRVDRDEYLKDMAAHLNITSSYLSAIENGKRPMPLDYLEMLGVCYDLPCEQVEKLREAANMEQKKVEIDMQDASFQKRNAAWAFARNFDKLSEDQLEKIRKVIEGDDSV
ncbi:helix-turn-helix domain-containing protein [Selenomonas felix]|uniref:helix-turn-helix domain-containing protein n=1 Tax=Selenomonas felix TaxID=1944634 RepID=UPI00206AA12A|nr:helix-turn-helix transcriptional regulator [Selenomonas felix]DAY45581.1 MAG TPA: helix-turn-helix domain protein [Caudoviricetes sp.]